MQLTDQRNPWDTGRSTGGSAAAVAARMMPFAHGSEGGGSIRIPSSCCGVFGLKPSRGRMPTGPGLGEVWEGLATDYAISISVRGNAALLDATAAPEVGAPYGIPAPARPFAGEVGANPGKLKIAYFSKGAADVTHPDCIAAVEDAARLCESLGHTVENAAPKIGYRALNGAFGLVVAGHVAAMLDRIGLAMGRLPGAEMFEPWTWNPAQYGWQATAAQFAGRYAGEAMLYRLGRTAGSDPALEDEVTLNCALSHFTNCFQLVFTHLEQSYRATTGGSIMARIKVMYMCATSSQKGRPGSTMNPGIRPGRTQSTARQSAGPSPPFDARRKRRHCGSC